MDFVFYYANNQIHTRIPFSNNSIEHAFGFSTHKRSIKYNQKSA